MEKLLKVSLDVYYTSIFMKKNRPAYKLSVLCKKEDEEKVADIIFKHTTSIGIRKYDVDRIILEREIVEFDSSLGKAKVKCVKNKDEIYIYPEYEVVKGLAEKNNISITDVYFKIISEYKLKFNM